MTSSHHAPYVLGCKHATMAGTKRCEPVRVSESRKAGLSSDRGLQLGPVKPESLVIAGQQRRVSEEGLRVVKLCCQGRTGGRGTAFAMTVPEKKAPANYVPAAAVIRRGQALSGIIGRKARVGGSVSPL